MKESHDEGIASHIGPESCVNGREAVGEALTGARAGRAIESRKRLSSECRRTCGCAEGHTAGLDKARDQGTPRDRQTPARTETPYPEAGRSRVRPSIARVRVMNPKGERWR